jgi:mono/diheme cytochrome c family protein
MRLGHSLPLLALLARAAGAQNPATVWDGIYSKAQSLGGGGLYAKSCASCHGAKLEGRDQAPPLAGAEFVMNWADANVGDLFEKMQTSMPGDRPGSLSPDQNAAILAYVLSANQFPAGARALSSDVEKLRPIRFGAAKGK